jgi:MIP family channel proteins
MLEAIRHHWPEYLMESAGLGVFMISAGLFTTLLEYPASPVHQSITSEFVRRMLIGLAMGLTAVGLIYSPWGQQSGAHFNPAVTLSFVLLGKVKPWDALFYGISQTIGGLAGVLLVSFTLRDLFREPPISYIATAPGPAGAWPAFAAEVLISFALMLTVLFVTNWQRLARYTGLFAGTLVFLFITFEAPISGMSMNPARSLASALPGGLWEGIWIYLSAPFLGMLVAVVLWKLISPRQATACAKLNHQTHKRCIFCGYGMQPVILLLFLGQAALKAQVTPVGIGPIAITVSDLDRSVDFYTRVLSFQKESETEGRRDSFDRLTGIFGTNTRVATLRLGTETVQLVEYRTPPGRQVPSDSQSNDGWFQHIAIVVRDMDAAYTRLREHKVGQISTNPQTLPQWNPNAGGIKAYYFRDPDNHSLELICFPQGKGDRRWQQSPEALFLGIDHTAIAVSDTGRDVSFYRNLLGFRIVGESLNYGSEQEELTHVFGCRLLITSLRAPAGPGIEFLEYLTPRNGRSFPANTQQNDLWSWSTTLIVKDLPAAVAELRRQNATFISAEPEDVSPLGESGTKGVLIRDPEGHALLLRSE